MKTAAGVTYLYDGEGRRVSKSNGKLYWYGSGGEILAETNASGTTTAEYIFFGGKRVAMLPAGANAQFYAEDFLGSSRVVTQNTGAVCYDADFPPYGQERAYTNSCSQNAYKFEGKERDSETQNDEFGARYYSWRFGRWLSADWSAVPVPVPYANLSNPQTLNLYAMVADDPESFADLDGHDTCNGPSNSCEAKNTPPVAGNTNLLVTQGQKKAADAKQNAQTAATVAQNTSETQTKQLTADEVSKGIKAYDSDKGDKQPGRVVKALDAMGNNFTATGDVVRAGVKQSGVDLPKDADKVLGNVDSISRTGNNVVITNKDSMTIMVLGQIGKTISFTINESVKGKSGYQGPALQNLKGVGIGIGRLAKHPDHWGPE